MYTGKVTVSLLLVLCGLRTCVIHVFHTYVPASGKYYEVFGGDISLMHRFTSNANGSYLCAIQ